MLPTLPHRVKIELTQIDPAHTPAVHPQFREPTGRVLYKAPVVLTAQLGLGDTNAYRQRAGGNDPQSDGHVVIRTADLKREAPTVVLHAGDRITKLYSGTGQAAQVTPFNWLVVKVEPAGHYFRRGFTLWVLYYRDEKNLASVA